MKSKGLTILFFALAALFLVSGVKAGGDALLGGVVLAALFAWLGYRRLKRAPAKAKKTQTEARPAAAAPARQPAPAAPAPQPEAPQRPRYQHVSFRVKGVTYKNDDGTDRQTILRHIKFADAPYVEGDDVTVQIKPETFDGKPALGCFINGYKIGFVPKERVDEITALMNRDGCEVSAFDISSGGKDEEGNRYPYGCEIFLRWPVSP